MAAVAVCRSLWAAARQLWPDRYPEEMSNAVRGLRCAFAAVTAFLAAAVTMRPDLFRGCPAELLAMRAALGTETLLADLRREMAEHLQVLPPPVGFRPPWMSGKFPTGPPNRG